MTLSISILPFLQSPLTLPPTPTSSHQQACRVQTPTQPNLSPSLMLCFATNQSMASLTWSSFLFFLYILHVSGRKLLFTFSFSVSFLFLQWWDSFRREKKKGRVLVKQMACQADGLSCIFTSLPCFSLSLLSFYVEANKYVALSYILHL